MEISNVLPIFFILILCTCKITRLYTLTLILFDNKFNKISIINRFLNNNILYLIKIIIFFYYYYNYNYFYLLS